VGNGVQARINIDATDTYSATVAGSRIEFLTSKPDGTLSRSLYIDEEQNIRLDDDRKAVFGTGSDLQIYHNGTHSFIEDTGTGDLILKASDQIKLQDASGQNMAVFNENGGVILTNAGNTKLATTSAGIAVTGKLTATNETAGEPALYVDGASNTGWGLEINSHNAASASDLVLNGNAVLGTGTTLSQTMPTGGYYRWMTGATSNTSGTAGATEVVRIDTSGLDVTGAITGTADATLNGLTVGRGAGDVSTNTAVGLAALQSNTTGAFNTAGGRQALRDNTTGTENTAYGYQALILNVGGSFNTAYGYRTLFSNTSGANNTAVGLQSLQDNTSGSANVAVGANALQGNTIGSSNTAVGRQALAANDTGNENTAQGYQALLSNAGGNNNTAQGFQALANNTSGSANTAVGRQALYLNTSGTSNTAVGREALQSNLTGNNNTAQGYLALKANTSGVNNTAQGTEALRANTTGINNTAVGRDALQSNTTGTFNTAVGRGAGSALTTGSNNTIVGSVAGEAGLADTVIIAAGEAERIRIDSNGNVGINTSSPDKMLHLSGGNALLQNGTGNTAIAIVANNNTSLAGNKIAFFGASRFEEDEEMAYIKPLLTSNNGGAGNVQLGRLTFGTSGEERMRIDEEGNLLVNRTSTDRAAKLRVDLAHGINGSAVYISRLGGTAAKAQIEFANNNGVVGKITTSGSATTYSTSSDYRLKTDAQPMTGASARVQALKPVNFEWLSDGTRVDGFIAHEAQEVVPECATGTKDAMMDEEYEVTPAVLDDEGKVVTEAVMGTRNVPDYQGIDQSKLVPLLTAALQEALAKIDALEARLTTLEAK
jgi:hypothetical protein